MQIINKPKDLDRIQIEYDNRWAEEKESLRMHSIHAYPAKFPPFLASNAFDYAMEEGVDISSAADIFCGCGTTALESKRRGISFWGCDINPVAVMITQAKIAEYDLKSLKKDYQVIITQYNKRKKDETDAFQKANERLQYWYDKDTYNDLYLLLLVIKETLTKATSEEQTFFTCIFSAILKQCSRWLQKSIKPQIDPDKHQADVIKEFSNRYKIAYSAAEQIVKEVGNNNAATTIDKASFLEHQDLPNVDLIITSPPYVTSYEYADLHQLSSLWLNYADDYRDLRKGTIGSRHISDRIDIDSMNLNDTAMKIISELEAKHCEASEKKSIATYYSDMQKAVKQCYDMLNKNGMALFVIGDSEKKGVKLKNAQHLTETMITEGFTDIKISKRQISKGICVPYRDKKGKFTKQKDSNNQIYHEEYIISGRKQ